MGSETWKAASLGMKISLPCDEYLPCSKCHHALWLRPLWESMMKYEVSVLGRTLHKQKIEATNLGMLWN